MSAERRATMAGGKTRGPRSAERRRQIRDRVALGVAALLLVVGLVVFFQSRTDSGPAPTQSAAPPVQTAPASNLKKGGTLEPDVRRVAARFLETAVGRTQLADAWDLATPELRSGVSRAEWMTGALPVPPFPVKDLQTTGFDVVESGPNKVLLQVLLVPKAGTEYVPTRYDMTIERASAKAPWKVSYCNPYAPPGVYASPD